MRGLAIAERFRSSAASFAKRRKQANRPFAFYYVKPYVDQKFDDMWVEIHRQLEELRTEKLELQKAQEKFSKTTSEVSVKKKERALKLHYKSETLLVNKEVAVIDLTTLAIEGCTYLVKELDRVGIRTLNQITETLDGLYLKLNGIGPYKLDKFWEQIKNLDGVSMKNDRLKTNAGTSNFIIKDDVLNAFEQKHFTLENKTKKAAEFIHGDTGEIIYLLPNKQLTVVIHPETAVNKLDATHEPSHSTALRRFPKEIKNGKTPTNYGYPYKFQTAEELSKFLQKI